MSAAHLAWLWVMLAGCMEVIWVVGLKQTQGFTRLWPSVITLALMATSFVLLSQALKVIPIGTAYAVWTGIGAAGGAVVGMWIYGESAHPMRLACIGLIILGIAGLKLLPAAS
jgi:quaternary ammonium compound-resistance protein SugE